jgi:hypothetical protein
MGIDPIVLGLLLEGSSSDWSKCGNKRFRRAARTGRNVGIHAQMMAALVSALVQLAITT